MFERTVQEPLEEDGFLRSLAMELFDRCLAEQNLMLMQTFIEQQFTEEPIPFELLIGLRDDLGLRLRELRAKRFELRAVLVQEITERCGVDIGPLLPTPPPVALQTRQLLDLIAAAATRPIPLEMLGTRAETFLQQTQQLQHEMDLTANVHALISDWLAGYLATAGYHDWLHERSERGLVQ
jgi:hypothetical protein